MADLTDIGGRIAWARAAFGLTLAGLGKELGVSRAAVSQYEKRRMRPRAEVVDKLAAVFHCAPEWFDRGHGEAPDASAGPPVIYYEAKVKFASVKYGLGRCNGFPLEVPGDVFPERPRGEVLLIEAPNDAGAVLRGDAVWIDTGRHDGGGVFLFVDDKSARLGHRCPRDARMLGRAIGRMRFVG